MKQCRVVCRSPIPLALSQIRSSPRNRWKLGRFLHHLRVAFVSSQRINVSCIQSYNFRKEEVLVGEPVEVSGHDCFQGTEKDTILITAFKPTAFEYLNSSQQIHLALTRARRCLIFCANFDKVKDVPIWKSFLKDANARGRLFEIRDDQFDFQSKLVKAQA